MLGLLRVKSMTKFDYPDWFEEIWREYPKRAGNNPKRKAFKQIQARLKEGHELSDIEAGLIRYAGFCEKTARIGSEFVMQAQRFFGTDEAWTEDWTPPETPTQKPDWAKLPFNDDDLWPFAKRHGFSAPANLTYKQYRSKLQREIEQRLTQRQE